MGRIFLIVAFLFLSGCSSCDHYGSPALIIRCNKIPGGHDSCALCACIMVKHGCHEDQALLAHEAIHVHQFYRTFGLHPILNACSKSYRMRCELEAYAVQYAVNLGCPSLYDVDSCLDCYAAALSENYGLTVSKCRAKQLILENVNFVRTVASHPNQ